MVTHLFLGALVLLVVGAAFCAFAVGAKEKNRTRFFQGLGLCVVGCGILLYAGVTEARRVQAQRERLETDIARLEALTYQTNRVLGFVTEKLDERVQSLGDLRALAAAKDKEAKAELDAALLFLRAKLADKDATDAVTATTVRYFIKTADKPVLDELLGRTFKFRIELFDTSLKDWAPVTLLRGEGVGPDAVRVLAVALIAARYKVVQIAAFERNVKNKHGVVDVGATPRNKYCLPLTVQDVKDWDPAKELCKSDYSGS